VMTIRAARRRRRSTDHDDDASEPEHGGVRLAG
jgi:hypothetical protein